MDIKTLLQSLLDHEVKFLVIGAWALPAYGYERMTKDVDIFFNPTKANAKRVVDALKAVGYDGIEDLPVQTILTKKVLMREYVLQADTHPFVKGISFGDAWKGRVRTEIKGLKVFVPSLGGLIAMKKAAGRARDKIDLQVLEKLREKKRKRKNKK
jgi:predicted nucleotidyltransferase